MGYSSKLSMKLETSSIVLYGAGYAGLHFCDLLLQAGINPVLFYDADKNKQGKVWHGIEIKNLDFEKHIEKDALVIVCLLRNDELYLSISKYLREKGFHKIIHMQNVQTDKGYRYLFDKQNLVLYVDKEKIDNNKDKIRYVRNFLEEEGKIIYDQIFAYINNDFVGHIDSLPILDQYWAYDLFTYNEEEIVFDCGAFDGTVMKEFMKRSGSFKAYYAFEPDKDNADRILNENDERVHIINRALSNKDTEMVLMRNYMNMNSVIIKEGDFTVSCMRLDDMEIMPTFIKIDVEGYEEKVIEGGRKIIEKGRPIIACAMYHSLEQLWKIPMMLSEMTTDYSYYVRSYMNLHETVFYAVPNERKIKGRLL